jgi:hypothetical protein
MERNDLEAGLAEGGAALFARSLIADLCVSGARPPPDAPAGALDEGAAPPPDGKESRMVSQYFSITELANLRRSTDTLTLSPGNDTDPVRRYVRH